MTEKKKTPRGKWAAAAGLFDEDKFDEIFECDLLKPLSNVNWWYNTRESAMSAMVKFSKFRTWAAGKSDNMPAGDKRNDFIICVNKTLRKIKRAAKNAENWSRT